MNSLEIFLALLAVTYITFLLSFTFIGSGLLVPRAGGQGGGQAGVGGHTAGKGIQGRRRLSDLNVLQVRRCKMLNRKVPAGASRCWG